MRIEDKLKDVKFSYSIHDLLIQLKTESLMNAYHLRAILELQVEQSELQKGKTGQELETSVESRINKLNETFREFLYRDMITDLDVDTDD